MWLVIALLGAVSAYLIATASYESLRGLMRARLSSMEAAAEVELRAAAHIDVSAARMVQWALLAAVIGFVVGLALSQSFFGAIFFGVVAFLLPRKWLQRERELRLRRIEEALPAAVDQMVSSIRAGLSLAQALEEASRTTPPPLSDEFALIHREIQLGARITDTISSAQRRIGGRSFPLLATALRTNVEKGGNLPEAMQRIAEAMKEIWRLEQKMLTASAEARKATKVISAMPVIIALMIFVFQPDLAASLTGSALGWVVIVVVIGLYVGGLVSLKRLTDPDV